MLEPPFLIALKRVLIELKIIFLQSLFFKRCASLLGLILLKNKISLAYILPIPETNF